MSDAGADDRAVVGRAPTVEWVELDDEVVIYDPAREAVHHLNATAARVWRSCDGARSLGEVRRALTAMSVPDDGIRELIAELLARGLVVPRRGAGPGPLLGAVDGV